MKSHRGLSAIVGTVFLVAVVVGALTYVSSSLETMANFSEQLVAEESRQKNIQDEKFDLLSVDIISNKLDATIKNTGDIPVKITTLYLDEMDVNDVVQKYSIDQTIPPGTTFNFLDESIDIDVDSTKGYSMKVVSSSGEMQTFYLNSASQEPLDIRLIASPERIPTGFSTTLMMVVVNNMSNNNPLVNLTPVEPTCSGICTKLSGPTPTSYDTLDPGDVAIFEWVFELSGDNGQSTTFTGELENGYPGNTDSETVTITTVELAEIAGQSLQSLGFGQHIVGDDLLVLHTETYGIPATAEYQLSTAVPDSTGTTLVLNDVTDIYNWFSANATSGDISIAAGNWNASLRYNSPRLPSGMGAGSSGIYDSADTSNGGHTLHFNTDSTIARKDSGQMSACTSLVDSGTLSGATWGATVGVNGSGAYYFDGNNDYITITGHTTKKTCNYPDTELPSIAGWFKSPVTASHARQAIFWKWDGTGIETGGYRVEIGDGTSNEHGAVFFRKIDAGGLTTVCKSDKPNGVGGNNYLDNQWHHFAAVEYAAGKCKLYIDGVQKADVIGTATITDHYTPSAISDVYIGVDRSINKDFTGYIDDIMFWNSYSLTASDVTALFNHSFGANSTRLNFYLNNATGVGTTVNVLAADTNYGMKWVDPMNYVDLDDLWAGGNWTKALPAVGLKEVSANRLNFTVGYASGAPLNLRVDDKNLDGATTTLLSSYIQTPKANPDLPTYRVYDNDDKITFFTFNGENEGVWFTYQGTRIVFNGTGGHYTGVIDTVDNGIVKATLEIGKDSPFMANDSTAAIIFWHPQNIPTASQPADSKKIPPGNYDVSVWIEGYDEDGTVFIRQIALGNVVVIE